MVDFNVELIKLIHSELEKKFPRVIKIGRVYQDEIKTICPVGSVNLMGVYLLCVKCRVLMRILYDKLKSWVCYDRESSSFFVTS